MSFGKYSIEQRVCLVKNKIKLKHNVSVIRLWCKEINGNPPNYKTINELLKRLEETGSVGDRRRSGRPVSVCTAENRKKWQNFMLKIHQHLQSERLMSWQSAIRQQDVLSNNLSCVFTFLVWCSIFMKMTLIGERSSVKQ